MFQTKQKASFEFRLLLSFDNNLVVTTNMIYSTAQSSNYLAVTYSHVPVHSLKQLLWQFYSFKQWLIMLMNRTLSNLLCNKTQMLYY